jgi:hypothetical protein
METGKYYGDYLGAWLGAQETDPNALYGSISVTVGLSGDLTSTDQGLSGTATLVVSLGGELTYTGKPEVTDPGWLGGGKAKRHARDYDFLDPQFWVKPKVAEIVTGVAKRALEPAEKDQAPYIPEQALKDALETNKEAWNAFYADLLRKQIEAEKTRQIQQHLIDLAVISEQMAAQIQAEEDEERAIIELLMEL